MSEILIVEDEPVIRGALRKLLERHEHSVTEAESTEQALEMALADFDLLISDLRLPGKPGTELIGPARPTPVLIMTSYASLRSAVDAMKLGAVDYIAKPFDHDEMIATVSRILDNGTPALAPRPAAGASRAPASVLIGECDGIRELQRRIEKVAATDTPVLICGEQGSGKELAARTLHELSHRGRDPMITVNCATLAADQAEAELFGVERETVEGAASKQRGLIESANGGTLFLDDVSELPMEAQGRLLRLLEQGEVRRVGSLSVKPVDVRLLAASSRDLARLVKDGKFRDDLYYRLNVVELTVPPLRERGDDVLLLAETLLARHAGRKPGMNLHFAEDARDAIARYYWPGNVRELENAVERAVLLAEADAIPASLLGIDPSAAPVTTRLDPQEDLSLEDYFARFVIEHQEHMTETELARKLGISRKSLWERRQRLGIPRRKPGDA